jgi:hypothetical protein
VLDVEGATTVITCVASPVAKRSGSVVECGAAALDVLGAAVVPDAEGRADLDLAARVLRTALDAERVPEDVDASARDGPAGVPAPVSCAADDAAVHPDTSAATAAIVVTQHRNRSGRTSPACHACSVRRRGEVSCQR